MDLIQTFAQAILDVILPQVHTHMRTHGTFSPTILGVTEDRIQAYMGASIGQALSSCLRFNVQDLQDTKLFCELLFKYISQSVNAVLALTTQTPILESKVPVIFVSGCVSYNRDLKCMVSHMAFILLQALNPQPDTVAMCNDIKSPWYNFNSRRDLKKMVKTYITRMVRVLRSSQRAPSRVSSDNQRDICIRVGTNAKLLTVEKSKSQQQKSTKDSFSGSDFIPGAVPDKSGSTSESSPFLLVTVIGTTENDLFSAIMENQTITNLADELVEAFLNDLGEVTETVAEQNTALQLDDVDKEKIRTFTDRVFELVMSGHDYQVPLVPAQRRMCETVTYRRLRRWDITDLGIITHTLYLRTEEVVTRCVVDVLLWQTLGYWGPDYPSTSSSLSTAAELFLRRDEAGDLSISSPEENISTDSLSRQSQISYATFSDDSESIESNLLENVLLGSLVTQLVGEMLIIMAIRNTAILLDLVPRIRQRLHQIGPMMYHFFHASLMGQRYNDIIQATFTNLLLEFASLQEMQEAVLARDPSFEEAMVTALTKQLSILSETAESDDDKKTTCSLLKKVKTLCCKTTSIKPSRATTNISPIKKGRTTNENDSELEGT